MREANANGKSTACIYPLLVYPFREADIFKLGHKIKNERLPF